jgi:bifunctional non-homologous end joining protein LigD
MARKKSIAAAGIKSPFPDRVEPMLCTLLKKPFDDDGWLYEVKLDGYRIIAYKQKRDVKLQSRGLLNFTRNYPPVVQELERLSHDVVLDGEICLLNAEGKPDFDALQGYKGSGLLVYYIFDILWLDGYSVMELPLLRRKELLKTVIPWNDVMRYSNDDFSSGVELFDQVRQMGMEGIVAKRKDSVYVEGKGHKRTRNWFKIPATIVTEFVIGGWTESASRRSFRSLLFGAYQNGVFVCVGHAGGGYKEPELPALMARL